MKTFKCDMRDADLAKVEEKLGVPLVPQDGVGTETLRLRLLFIFLTSKPTERPRSSPRVSQGGDVEVSSEVWERGRVRFF